MSHVPRLPIPPNSYSQVIESRRNAAIERALRERVTDHDSAWQKFGVEFPVFTGADILDIGHNVNVNMKSEGRVVWDSTNKRLMVADGALAADLWYIADGSASVTPV
jgi:hypothetical protein